MDVPDDLSYSKDHEWIRADDTGRRIGITDYAQDALGDVVFPELVNADPYGDGWFMVIETADGSEQLMDATAYRELTEG